jgi:hypothetical protein
MTPPSSFKTGYPTFSLPTFGLDTFTPPTKLDVTSLPKAVLDFPGAKDVFEAPKGGVKLAANDDPKTYATAGDAKKDIDAGLGDAKKLAKAHDYEGAASKVNDTLGKAYKYDGGNSIANGAGVLNQVEDGKGDAAKTLAKQYAFCADMEKAGIKTDNPPSQKDLKAYFGTFKGPPQDKAGALKAYEKYADAYSQHTKGDATYAYPDKSKHPQSWGDTQHPEKSGSYEGKSMNDCKGYALMGKELLGAAGFTNPEFVSAGPRKGATVGHEMLAMKDDKGNPVVVSNGKTFTGTDKKDVLTTACTSTSSADPSEMYADTTSVGSATAAGEKDDTKLVK